MKNNKKFPSLLVFAAVILAACSLHSCSKSSGNTAAADSAYVTATIQGLAFSAKGINQAYAGSSSSGGLTVLSIYGVAANGQAIVLNLVNNAGVGVTYLATAGGSADYYPSGGLQGSYFYATSGSVTLTATTPNLKGSFSFVTSDSKTIGAGSFSVPAP